MRLGALGHAVELGIAEGLEPGRRHGVPLARIASIMTILRLILRRSAYAIHPRTAGWASLEYQLGSNQRRAAGGDGVGVVMGSPPMPRARGRRGCRLRRP